MKYDKNENAAGIKRLGNSWSIKQLGLQNPILRQQEPNNGGKDRACQQYCMDRPEDCDPHSLIFLFFIESPSNSMFFDLAEFFVIMSSDYGFAMLQHFSQIP